MTDLAIYEANGKEIQLSKDTVKQYLVSGNGKVSDQEVVMFMELCKYQELNPFLKEAYLIKYSDRAPASIVVGKEAYMKRAQAQPDYERFEAGIIIQRNNQLMEVEGSFKLPQDSLLGGWAKIYRKGIKEPNITRVSMTEYSQGQSTWAKMPATMIRKVAIVQAIRETYPEQFGGMYIEEEMNKEPIIVEEQPIKKEKNFTKRANKKTLPGQNEEPEEDDEEIIIEAEVEVAEEVDQALVNTRNELYQAVKEKDLSNEIITELINLNYKKEQSTDLSIDELEDLISVVRIYQE